MDPSLLRDRVQRGNGVAARRLGSIHDVLRPDGSGPPLARANRVLRLHASFNAEDETYRRPQAFGRSVWWGVFDSAYTRPGDYLVGRDAAYFVAAQQELLPVQCVRTNCVLTGVRPLGSSRAGVSDYGGVQDDASAQLFERWPASLLMGGGGGKDSLPGSAGAASWIVLLPCLPVALQSSDLLHDQAGGLYLVEAAESSDLGWRLRVRSTPA